MDCFNTLKYNFETLDALDDSLNTTDIRLVKAFINNEYLYVLIEFENYQDDFIQMDILINPDESGWPADYMLNWSPGDEDLYLSQIVNEEFNEFGRIGKSQADDVFEAKVPLEGVQFNNLDFQKKQKRLPFLLLFK